MASCIDEIRSHVFKAIHDFADCDVEVSAFGACLPPGVAATIVMAEQSTVGPDRIVVAALGTEGG